MSDRRLFLSYRREDSAGHSGRLADHLLDRFGAGSVFMDVDSIGAGADFTAEIRRAIEASDAVLVVIGPGWLEARGPDGNRRLDVDGDLVRREIEAALASEVRVIPVLVGGASMPAEEHLPISIAALARRNAVELQDRRWREDVDALVDLLEERGRATGGNLTEPLTSFLGRDRELEEVLELLRREHVRLLTLTGPGGIGKTRLAVRAASELTDAYGGGVWFVGLASLADPALVLVEVARVLGLREAAQETLVDAIASRLSRARTLIVLDNLEQLLPDAASPVAQLLLALPSLDLIATSRQPLQVTAEREYPVSTLTEPEAVALFTERARAVRPDFEPGDHAKRQAIAQICARLDGLPLAIELAAARTRLLEPQDMLSRLERRLDMLTGGARDIPVRQQTLRATIDWSYQLLTPEDRWIFARLSVFAGGWTLDAADAICGVDEPALDILQGMESLAQNSLLQRHGTDHSSRFAMLETVREYAWERLHDGGDLEEVAKRHAEYYLSQAELAFAELRGSNPARWFDRLEPELDNFRTAIRSSLAHGRTSLALRVMSALMLSLEPRGYWQEARALGLDEVVARTANERTPERAQVLFAAGTLCLYQGRMKDSQELLESAVDIARKLEDRRTLALTLPRLAWARRMRGGEDVPGSVALAEEGVGLARTLDDPWVLAEALNDLAGVVGEHAYSPRAVGLVEESLGLRRAMGYLPGVAESLNNLAWEALLGEDYPKAVALLHESVELAETLSLRLHVVVMAKDNLALAHLFIGETELAETLFRENLRECRDRGDVRIGLEALLGMAGVAAGLSDWKKAARLVGAAATLTTSLEMPVTDVDLRIRERVESDARRALGDDGYEAEHLRGGLASFEEAVDLALDEPVSSARSRRTPRGSS